MAQPTDLLDANIWLAFSVGDHPHHERARRYWVEEAGDRLAFCRATALAFLRLTTNSAVMAGDPMSVAEAWAAYLALRRTPEVVLTPEPDGCERALEVILTAGSITPRLWTDAYLAAFAISGGMRLVTFDADFARFAGVDLLTLR